MTGRPVAEKVKPWNSREIFRPDLGAKQPDGSAEYRKHNLGQIHEQLWISPDLTQEGMNEIRLFP